MYLSETYGTCLLKLETAKNIIFGFCVQLPKLYDSKCIAECHI